MGFFDWLLKTATNVTARADVIWLNKQAKLNGISQAISRSLADPNGPAAVILVAHFRDCLGDAQQLVKSLAPSNAVSVVAAETLKDLGAPTLSSGGSQSILILVAERHPLLSHDEVILEFARRLLCRATVVHHIALDDAVMRKFSAGEWLGNVLKKLGLTEMEPIESQMASRRLRAAQQKLTRDCAHDYPAESAQAWIDRNCPNA